MSVEKCQGAVLDEFILDSLRVELDAEVEEQGLLSPDPLTEHLLLRVQPALVVVDIRELQTKIPFLPDARGLEDIVKQLPAKRRLSDPELCI